MSRFPPDRTGKTAVAPRQRRCAVRPGPARRFAWPSGGTEEFLGRWSARSSSWGTEAKGALADPLYVFGAAGRAATPGVVGPDHDGNRNDRTSRRRQQGTTLVTRGTTVPNRRNQVGNSGVRALTSVSIYGFGVPCPSDHYFLSAGVFLSRISRSGAPFLVTNSSGRRTSDPSPFMHTFRLSPSRE